MRVEASAVSQTTNQDAGAPGSCVQRKFVPAPIWTEAMLAALQTGVKGGKWHSLIDKVWRQDTLALGWAQVERNAGAAGVDRMSVERFAQARECYLGELASALRDGSYLPQPVRRAYMSPFRGSRRKRCSVTWMYVLFCGLSAMRGLTAPAGDRQTNP